VGRNGRRRTLSQAIAPRDRSTSLRSMMRVCILLLAMAMVGLPGWGQTPVGKDGAWVTLGVGRLEAPPSVELNGSSCHARGELCLRYAVEHSASLLSDGPGRKTGISLGIGKRHLGRGHLAAQFIGISCNRFADRETRPTQVEIRPGICANTQFFVKPLADEWPEFGIGFELFGDLNATRSFYGVRASLVFHNTK